MNKTITLDREAFEDALEILRRDSMPILAQSVATDLEAAVVHRESLPLSNNPNPEKWDD